MPVENKLFYEYLNRLLDNFVNNDRESAEDQRCRFVLALNKMKQYLTNAEDKASIDHITSDYFVPKNADGSLNYAEFQAHLGSQEKQYVDYMIQVLNPFAPLRGEKTATARSYQSNLLKCSKLVENALNQSSYKESNEKAIKSYKKNGADFQIFFRDEKGTLYQKYLNEHPNRHTQEINYMLDDRNRSLMDFGLNATREIPDYMSKFDKEFLNVFTSNVPKLETGQISEEYISVARPFFDFQQVFMKQEKYPQDQKISFGDDKNQRIFTQFGLLSETVDELRKGLGKIRDIKKSLAPTEKIIKEKDGSEHPASSGTYTDMSNEFGSLANHLTSSGTKLSDLSQSIETCQAKTNRYIQSKRWSLSRFFSRNAKAHYAAALKAKEELASMQTALQNLNANASDFQPSELVFDKGMAFHCEPSEPTILKQNGKKECKPTDSKRTSFVELDPAGKDVVVHKMNPSGTDDAKKEEKNKGIHPNGH